MPEHVTKILNGKGVASQMRAQLKRKIAQVKGTPTLAVVLLGHDQESEYYIDFVQQAEGVGIAIRTVDLDVDTSEDKLASVIAKLNKNKKVHGIMLQTPFVADIPMEEVAALIDPLKDVEGLHPENVGLLTYGEPRYIPSMPSAIWTLINGTPVDVNGTHAVIVDASDLIGRPLAQMLLNAGANVTVLDRLTDQTEIAHHTKLADIVVTAANIPKLITADMIRKNAMVIDAGLTTHRGAIVGDVDYDSVVEKAGYITPVPGGVDPMTTAALLVNTWEAFKRV